MSSQRQSRAVEARRSVFLCCIILVAVAILPAEAFSGNRQFRHVTPLVTIPSRLPQTKYLNIQSKSSSLLRANKNDVCVDVVSFFFLHKVFQPIVRFSGFSCRIYYFYFVFCRLLRTLMKIGQSEGSVLVVDLL